MIVHSPLQESSAEPMSGFPIDIKTKTRYHKLFNITNSDSLTIVENHVEDVGAKYRISHDALTFPKHMARMKKCKNTRYFIVVRMLNNS